MAEEKKQDINKTENGEAENIADDLDVKNEEKKVEPEKANEDKIIKRKAKKIKKQVLKGKANVKCTYNNTIISITDLGGNVLGWASSGLLGFKGAKKATPYAATQVVGNVAEKVKKYGVQELEVYVMGVGSGREASIRALANKGFELTLIKDKTPVPHNGCRAKKPRRV